MWGRIKKRIYDFFIVETVETIDESIHIPVEENDERQQPVHTRMTYKYPEKEFRFPLIPDEVQNYDRTYQLSEHKKSQRHQRRSVSLEQSSKPLSPVTLNDEKPFVPSRVSSPIYGYQQRKKNKDIEKVPAYIRRQLRRGDHDEGQLVDEPSNDQREAAVTTESLMNATHSRVADRSLNRDDNETVATNKPEKSEHITQSQADQTSRPSKTTDHQLHKNEKISQMDYHESGSEKQATPDRKQIKAKQTQQVKKETQRSRKRHPSTRDPNEQPIPYNVIMTPNDKKKLRKKQFTQQEHKGDTKTYHIPYHLLNDPERASNEDRRWVREQQRLLEQTLKHFNVKAHVVQATQGPTVTRFEVKPDLGVKVSRVRNLSDDIKLNMAAKDIRIEAPIPGKNTIGIEVPNLNAQMVGLQEIFDTASFKHSDNPLTIGLGLNVEGKPLTTTISEMPHGLIAGATGSGKSVCINTILISLLYKESYENLKLLLIDPKMVELAPYNGIPHLVSPVITDVKAATAALKWAVDQMEGRYEKFVQEGVRDIHRYNEKMISEQRLDEKMPFMVIVIDELADLMMASPQDVEDAICRIAQKARACGMHLLLATQRPSVDVITGLIKANIPTRIAFSVSSQVDSRTIIDTNGAEKLLGKGDMLFIENGSGKSIRLQGAFVSDEEIERVTHYVRQIAHPNYLFEQEELLKQIEVDEEEDELLEDVIQFIFEQDSASTSMLQRQFRIGYNRAARLIDTLENKGVISEQNGSKPRDVLMTKAQLDDVLN